MSPRQPITSKPMTSAERVKRARWSNKVEETAFKLLDLLNNMPEPLPRNPEIPVELIDRLEPFMISTEVTTTSTNEPHQNVLQPGNGNQARNKKLAVEFIMKHLKASAIDKKTLQTKLFGKCHVAAYTHPKGAMISTPNRGDQSYGDAEWHGNDHNLYDAHVF